MRTRLEIRHLKAIRAISRMGSLHRAAKELGTSQPALSRLIKEAEERLGLKLFERSSSGSQPTECGQIIDEVSRRVLIDMDRLDQFRLDTCWSIKVGCIHRALDFVVPRLLERAAHLSPYLRFELRENDSQTLMDELENGQLDVAVLSPGVRVPLHVDTQPLYVDRNVFVIGQPSRCRLNFPIIAKSLSCHEFIAPAPGTPSRYEFDEYWLEEGIAAPVCRLSSRTYDAIARALPDTSLVAVLPSAVAQEYATKGMVQILQVVRNLPLRPVHVAWNSRTLSSATRDVVDVLLEQVAS